MSEIQATYTVEGVTFETKKEARAYRAVCERVVEFCNNNYIDSSFMAEAMKDAYKAGIFSPPKVGRGPAKAK